MEGNDPIRLVVLDFNSEEDAVVDGTEVLDFEAVLQGVFEFLETGHVVADKQEVVNVEGNEKDNIIGVFEEDAFVSSET